MSLMMLTLLTDPLLIKQRASSLWSIALSYMEINLMTTLLLIEDNPETIRMVCRVLKPFGYDVQVANCGLDGIRMAREGSPEIVLIDMNLPDLEGKGIVTLLRGGRILDESAVLIAFTAECDARTRRIVRMLGCDDLIGKPIDTQAFPNQIAEIVQRKAQQNGR
jgi:two-component system, OmpR family, KDP operon response regulator KdpE